MKSRQTLHVYFLFPETAGRPLEEVQAMFSDPNGIKYLGTPAWKTKSYYRIESQIEATDMEKKMAKEESPERHEVAPEKAFG